MHVALRGLVAAVIVVLASATAARAQSAGAGASEADRYRALLAPHGEWVTAAPHGEVFVPREAREEGFAPYLSGGRWVAGDRGLRFDSRYAWGAVCFHHGRWARLPTLDVWAWVPSEEWASAWVEWRRRGSDVAWRPIAPAGAPASAMWSVAPLGSIGAADLASRALRVGNDTVASFTPLTEMTPEGGREASPRVPRGQVMLSGGGHIVVHEPGRDRVIEVDPVIVPRGSAEEREALRRAEVAREREAAREAREREAAARALAAAPAAPAVTATATATVTAPAPPPPARSGTAWTVGTVGGWGYGPYGWGYGAPGYVYGGPGYPSGGTGYGSAPASAPPRDPYAPPRFSAPRLPFGGWRE